MENIPEDEVLIERFLANVLTEEEKKVFATRQGDPVFTELLTFHQDLHVVATQAGKLTLKERLRQVEKKREQPKGLRLGFRRKLAIAATLLLLIAAGTFWYAQANYSNQALLAANYSAPNFSAPRSTQQDVLYAEAARAFYTGEYEEVISSLKKNDQNTPASSLLLAHAYLKTNQADLAIAKRPVTGADELKEEWQWVELLASLANGDASRLQQQLAELTSNPKHAYHNKAKVIQEQTQSTWRRLTR